MRTILFLVAGLFLMSFTSHRGEDVLRAFLLFFFFWTKSVADDHCHQHVDRGFKGRLLGGRRIAHIAPAVRGSRCLQMVLVRWRFL